MSGYRYQGFANAATLSRSLVSRADALAQAAEEVEAARQEALSSLAAQIRANEAAQADRDLVRATINRQRDRRIA